MTFSGCTIPLNTVVSSFTPFGSGAPVGITCGVTAVPESSTHLSWNGDRLWGTFQTQGSG